MDEIDPSFVFQKLLPTIFISSWIYEKDNVSYNRNTQFYFFIKIEMIKYHSINFKLQVDVQ